MQLIVWTVTYNYKLVAVFVLEHVISDGGSDIFSITILTKIVDKASIWAHQIHDDSMINLQRMKAYIY